MKISDTTPKPVERTFTIELTENELKNITLIIGLSTPNVLKKMIEMDNWNVKVLGGMTFINPNDYYDKFKDAITNK